MIVLVCRDCGDVRELKNDGRRVWCKCKHSEAWFKQKYGVWNTRGTCEIMNVVYAKKSGESLQSKD